MASPRGSGPHARTGSIRIVHVVTRSHRRGAELAAMELAAELDERGHHNRVVALSPAFDGSHEPGLVPLADSVGIGPRGLLTRVRALRRLVAEETPDVVIAHGGSAAQLLVLALPRRRPLLVWQRILGFPSEVWAPVRRTWWRAVAARVDIAVALTGDLESELRRLGFDKPVWIIPNSRRTERFAHLDRGKAAAGLRAELDVDPDVPLIGFVGHLVRQKRAERAIAVIARLDAMRCPAHLVIAGDGPLRPELEAVVARGGLDHLVTFLGHRSDVETVLGGVELALLTSEAEGIPGVAIEALMSGCPLVAFRIGGVDQVVDDGVTGVLIDGEDPSEMADVVASLLADDGERTAMGQRARLGSHRYSASTTAEIYERRLTEALERSR